MFRENHFTGKKTNDGKSPLEDAFLSREVREVDRGLKHYLAMFDLQVDDLKGRRILDIGAGSANFSKDAKKEGIDVTAIDPLYKYKEGRNLIKDYKYVEENRLEKFHRVLSMLSRKKGFLPNAVAALGEQLPFRDESFDMVCSIYSSFHYATTPEIIYRNFEEQLRVLTKGGSLYTFPVRKSKQGNLILCLDQDFVRDKDTVRAAFESELQRRQDDEQISVSIGDPRFNELMFDMPYGSQVESYVHIRKN